jgi:NH3-dependent NAD+ synthetase
MKKMQFSGFTTTIGMTGLVALALGMTSVAAADPAADAPKTEKNETMIIKMVKHDGTPGEHSKEDIAKIMADCGVDKATVDTESETKDSDGKVKRARVVICNRDTGLDKQAMVKRLEEARNRVAEVTELSGEARAKALASLDAEIARLKSEK